MVHAQCGGFGGLRLCVGCWAAVVGETVSEMEGAWREVADEDKDWAFGDPCRCLVPSPGSKDALAEPIGSLACP